jgi:putative endonuclease
MRDGSYLVFVEVRHRKSQKYGGALESVDLHKQRKLRKAAEYYLIRNKKTDSPCRFDILCVDGDLTEPKYNWIKNAF